MTADEKLTAYRVSRRWGLHELMRVAVCREVGSMSASAAKRERRQLQRDMAAARSKRGV